MNDDAINDIANLERPIHFCAIGASAGGVMAIRKLLANLDDHFAIPIGVVQHLPATSRIDVSMIYSVGIRTVLEIEDKMPIERAHVYMAPPAYHLLIERGNSFALTQDEPENYSRPSIDVFFRSAARAFGENCLGILLTGANTDGASGLAAIGNAGGFTIAQNLEEAECETMPKSAIDLRTPDAVLRLDEMVKLLNTLGRRELGQATSQAMNRVTAKMT